jgi:hypothetical protein
MVSDSETIQKTGFWEVTRNESPILNGWSATRNVWSATVSQAKNESDNSLVCANVYGLRWSAKLLALMECAAPSSYLVRQS